MGRKSRRKREQRSAAHAQAGRRFRALLETARILAGGTPFQRAMVLAELEDRQREPGPCSLCGAMTRDHGMGVYEPPQAQELGAEPGKCRVVFYNLCAGCQDADGVARVEEQMFEHYRLKRRAAEAAAAGVEIFS
jgi:hypothetical protein